nr:MAG TPA: DNA methyltransferase [Caudoviricetes sp.]
MRILNEAKPRYFLLENVPMKEEWIKIINQHL